MHMKKILFIVFLLVVFTLALILLNGNKEADPLLTSPSPTVSPTPSVSAEADVIIEQDEETGILGEKTTHDVAITKEGVSPQNLTIKAGDTVRFTNNDSVLHWPASGVHPSHQICSGFDALRSLEQGGTYSFTFEEPKECPFHDHLNPGSSNLKGKITVTE